MKRAIRKLSWWSFQFLVVSSALLTLFIAVTPQGRTGLSTVFFVLEILDAPVTPRQWFPPDPVRQRVAYQSSGETIVAEVYRLPDGEPRPAALLSLGLTDLGFDHPNAILLGHALARSGIVVMYHWSPPGFRIDVDDLEHMVSGFRFLEQQDYVDPSRVGLGGFCVGASFALVASADERVRDRVLAVNAFGPYFDARELLLQLTSRTIPGPQGRIPWDPDPYTLEVFAHGILDSLGSEGDAAILRRHFPTGPPLPPASFDALTPEGQMAADLLAGVSYEEAELLFEELPMEFRETLDTISPSMYIEDIQARVLVLHDVHDMVIPVNESRDLVEELKRTGDVRFTEVTNFEHTLPDAGGPLVKMQQAARLYLHMYELLRLAH